MGRETHAEKEREGGSVSFEPLVGWSKPIRDKWQLSYMLMTQLDHGTVLSPSTPQYKTDSDLNKPLTLPPWTSKYPSTTTPHHPQTEAKKEGETMLNKNTDLSPYVMFPPLSRRRWLSACLRHGRPTLLTSDVSESCRDDLANPLTFAPAVQNLWTRDDGRPKSLVGNMWSEELHLKKWG